MSNKIAVRLKIDVSKIDKARLFKGSKGTYLDCSAFIDPDNPGQYGDHGMITQDVTKEEREQGVKGAILGNVEVFWRDGQHQPAQQQHSNHSTAPQRSAPPADDFADDDIPF